VPGSSRRVYKGATGGYTGVRYEEVGLGLGFWYRV
jgi:hypothetical protein